MVPRLLSDFKSKMIYCWISEEMSSLYFGLNVVCKLEARAPPEFDVVYISTAVPVLLVERCLICKAVASNRPTTTSPKYNDDITLVI
jgi:hypothetical protein